MPARSKLRGLCLKGKSFGEERGGEEKGERRCIRRHHPLLYQQLRRRKSFLVGVLSTATRIPSPPLATVANAENSCGARFQDRPGRSTCTWRYQHQLDAEKTCKKAQENPPSPHKRLVGVPLWALTGSPQPRTAASCPDDRRGHWTNSESPLATAEVSKQRPFSCASHRMGEVTGKGGHRHRASRSRQP